MNLTFAVLNGEAVLRAIGGVEIGLSDFSQPLAENARTLHESVVDTFAFGGRPQTWTDVLPSTLKGRKVNQDAPPLTDSGALEEVASAIDGDVEIGNRRSLYELTPGSVQIGVDGPDVRAHQLGNPRLKADGEIGGEPARPFLIFQPTDESLIFSAHEMYVQSLLEHAK